jgi:dienelactone hydrolase
MADKLAMAGYLILMPNFFGEKPVAILNTKIINKAKNFAENDYLHTILFYFFPIGWFS